MNEPEQQEQRITQVSLTVEINDDEWTAEMYNIFADNDEEVGSIEWADRASDVEDDAVVIDEGLTAGERIQSGVDVAAFQW